MTIARPRPLARIRTDVVVLLADLDCRGPVNEWTRLDGQPLTDQERHLAASATGGELLAAADHSGRILDEQTKHIAGLDRIRELTAPYFAKLPAGATFGDAMAIMPPAERAELDAIAATLPIDGNVIVDPDA